MFNLLYDYIYQYGKEKIFKTSIFSLLVMMSDDNIKYILTLLLLTKSSFVNTKNIEQSGHVTRMLMQLSLLSPIKKFGWSSDIWTN